MSDERGPGPFWLWILPLGIVLLACTAFCSWLGMMAGVWAR